MMDELKLDKTYLNQIKKIKKERSKKRKELIANGMNENHASNQAQFHVNQIYGKGWDETLRWKDENLNRAYYNKKYRNFYIRTEGIILHENKFEEFWKD